MFSFSLSLSLSLPLSLSALPTSGTSQRRRLCAGELPKHTGALGRGGERERRVRSGGLGARLRGSGVAESRINRRARPMCAATRFSSSSLLSISRGLAWFREHAVRRTQFDSSSYGLTGVERIKAKKLFCLLRELPDRASTKGLDFYPLPLVGIWN